MGYSNTVVAASDMNYFWGVFLMIASMRCYGMREPVIVLGTGYTPEAGRLLSQFGDVTVHEASPSSRSLTCRKPEALLLAETDYATWVDCDGFFSGNCSALLTPPDQDHIRIRRRSLRENLNVYPDAGGRIPDDVLDVWRRDVGERAEARLDTCCSACFMSVPGKHRKFLERWRDQMPRRISRRMNPF